MLNLRSIWNVGQQDNTLRLIRRVLTLNNFSYEYDRLQKNNYK